MGQMADLKPETEFLCAFVEQQNSEDLVINHALDYLSYAVQQGVQIKRGVQNIRDFDEQRLDVYAWGWSGNCG